jgi:hypothetical protein
MFIFIWSSYSIFFIHLLKVFCCIVTALPSFILSLLSWKLLFVLHSTELSHNSQHSCLWAIFYTHVCAMLRVLASYIQLRTVLFFISQLLFYRLCPLRNRLRVLRWPQPLAVSKTIWGEGILTFLWNEGLSQARRCGYHPTVSSHDTKQNKKPWPEFASELYRPSDRRSSAELVPTIAKIGLSRSQCGGSPTAIISIF